MPVTLQPPTPSSSTAPVGPSCHEELNWSATDVLFPSHLFYTDTTGWLLLDLPRKRAKWDWLVLFFFSFPEENELEDRAEMGNLLSSLSRVPSWIAKASPNSLMAVTSIVVVFLSSSFLPLTFSLCLWANGRTVTLTSLSVIWLLCVVLLTVLRPPSGNKDSARCFP